MGRHPSEKFIDPLDGLAVIAQAAEDALTAQASILTLMGSPAKGNMGDMGGAGVPGRFPPLTDIKYIDQSDANRAPMSMAGGRSVSRLTDEIKSLRVSGEQAFSDNSGGNTLLAAALKKQVEAEATAQAAQLAYRAEQRKRVDLQASLETLKKLNDAVRGARDEKDEIARLTQQRLMSDVATNADNLKRVKANKKKRLRASITIALFLKKKVIPYFRRLKKERERANLGNALLGVFHRKHFLKTMDLRTRATLLLQKRMRGVLGRKRMLKLKKAAINLQRVYRGSRGRDKYTKMLLNRAAGRFSAKYRAAEKLKRVLQRFVKRMKAKRENAAVTIQSASRRRVAMKEVSGLRDNERSRVAARRLAEENQRLMDLDAEQRDKAAGLIGRMARDKYAIRDARGYRDRLLSEREQREKDAQDARDRFSLENKSALCIQAAGRGR